METNYLITIKQAIGKHPTIAKGLKRNSKTFDTDIKEFASITKIGEGFLRLNIVQIRYWID